MRLSATTGSSAARLPERLEWDSEFWGIGVGRAYTASEDLTRWALENTVGLVCLLVDAADTDEIQKAEERGFRLMDVRITMRAPAAENTSSSARRGVPSRIDDVDALAAIARSAHRITRFYADPRLDDGECDELYERWLRRSCAGWADEVFVDSEDRPAGYATCHIDERGKEGNIGLIAVAERSRERGIGAGLVRACLAHSRARGAETVTVVTQGRNIAAQRLFASQGFRLERTEVWLHKWYA